ncbi:Uncharacterised protein [Enterobacter cloacae]|nr:Uncharacterised protein [Enterobacter cloacae]
MDAVLPLTFVCRLSNARAVASLSVTITSSMRSSCALLPATDADKVLRVAT